MFNAMIFPSRPLPDRLRMMQAFCTECRDQAYDEAFFALINPAPPTDQQTCSGLSRKLLLNLVESKP